MNVTTFRRVNYNTALAAIENLINATPTGSLRDELTEVNMKMMELQDKQMEVDRRVDAEAPRSVV